MRGVHPLDENDDLAGDAWNVFANAVGDRVFAPGARLLLLPNPGNGNDRVMCIGLSRGKRWVCIWRDIRYVKNARVQWTPPRFRRHPRWYRWARDRAETMLRSVRARLKEWDERG